jgi:hypothetical protein
VALWVFWGLLLLTPRGESKLVPRGPSGCIRGSLEALLGRIQNGLGAHREAPWVCWGLLLLTPWALRGTLWNPLGANQNVLSGDPWLFWGLLLLTPPGESKMVSQALGGKQSQRQKLCITFFQNRFWNLGASAALNPKSC